MARKIYIIGALKNRSIMDLAERLRAQGHEVFDEWITPGPEADAFLYEYGKKRNLSYKQTLATYACRHVFEFDREHMDRCDLGIMVMPAGRSGHLELGRMLGQGKPGYILFDGEPDRMDVMYNFATDIFFTEEDLIKCLAGQS